MPISCMLFRRYIPISTLVLLEMKSNQMNYICNPNYSVMVSKCKPFLYDQNRIHVLNFNSNPCSRKCEIRSGWKINWWIFVQIHLHFHPLQFNPIVHCSASMWSYFVLIRKSQENISHSKFTKWFHLQAALGCIKTISSC